MAGGLDEFWRKMLVTPGGYYGLGVPAGRCPWHLEPMLVEPGPDPPASLLDALGPVGHKTLSIDRAPVATPRALPSSPLLICSPPFPVVLYLCLLQAKPGLRNAQDLSHF